MRNGWICWLAIRCIRQQEEAIDRATLVYQMRQQEKPFCWLYFPRIRRGQLSQQFKNMRSSDLGIKCCIVNKSKIRKAIQPNLTSKRPLLSKLGNFFQRVTCLSPINFLIGCCLGDDNINMILNSIRLLTRTAPSRSSFATTVTKDQFSYYNVLEVEESATEQAIRAAYAELTRGLLPEIDAARFKQLSEAFVILTDLKTRDAYDSLLKVRKTHYLSAEEQAVPSTRSYLSLRRQDKLEELKSRLNIDQFGRYKGGLPQKYGQLRGSSRAEAGAMHRAVEIEEQLDRFPEFNNVTAEKAESFKNFHQDEREARQMKWPWFSFQVDYDFFSFRTFRKSYWPKIQLLVFIFYVAPTLFYAILKFQKQQATQQLKQKTQKKAETEAQPPAEHAA